MNDDMQSGESTLDKLSVAGSPVNLAAEGDGAMDETLHILSSPANAERIRQGLRDFEAGNLEAGELCD